MTFSLFLGIWHFISVDLKITEVLEQFEASLKQNILLIEKNHIDKNILDIQKIFRKIIGETINRIDVGLNEEIEGVTKNFTIGAIRFTSMPVKNINYSLEVHRKRFGYSIVMIDMLDLNIEVIKDNIFLYIHLSFLILVIIFLSNLSFLRTIDDIKKILNEFNNKFEDGHIKNVKVNDLNIPSGTGFRSICSRLMLNFIKEYERKSDLQNDLKISRELEKNYKQVAHDIKSPLAALNSGLKYLDNVPKGKKKIIDHAISRITDISNQLLIKGQQNNKSNFSKINQESIYLLSSLIESLVTEKRLEYRSYPDVIIDFMINEKSYGLFAKICSIEFKRILSNLINNSIEAFEGKKGKIIVKITHQSSRVKISIKDDGYGMSEETLEKIKTGIYTNKQEGCGLGLSHAKKYVETWGGEIEIYSKLKEGTDVRIFLPLAKSPSWFVQSLKLPESKKVLVLDDEKVVHEVWKNKFHSLQLKINIISFYNESDLKEWLMQNNHTKEFILLCDYDLGEKSKNGIDFIIDHKLNLQAILVTSRFEEFAIQQKCENEGIKLLPKSYVEWVTIEESNEKEYFDAILIDDDDLVRANWEESARLNRKKIKSFSSFKNFILKSESFNRESVIFIDYELKNDEQKKDFYKIIHDHGFKKIWIQTGYLESEVTKPKFVSGVIGKTPIWEI